MTKPAPAISIFSIKLLKSDWGISRLRQAANSWAISRGGLLRIEASFKATEVEISPKASSLGTSKREGFILAKASFGSLSLSRSTLYNS